MSNDLHDRVALVTGAWRGIGRAVARRLIDAGAIVAVNVRDEERAQQAAAALGPNAVPAPGDVSRGDAVEQIVETVLDRCARIDVLVNNAALAVGTRFPELGEEEWRCAFDVNVTGPFLLIKAVYPTMQRLGRGRIVNMGSLAGRTVSNLGGAHYTASKHALIGLTRAAARELGPLGITVNAICPGVIDTELVRQVDPERVQQLVGGQVPLRRLGTADEVAELVCFLTSDGAGYINGAAIDINGGMLMM